MEVKTVCQVFFGDGPHYALHPARGERNVSPSESIGMKPASACPPGCSQTFHQQNQSAFAASRAKCCRHLAPCDQPRSRALWLPPIRPQGTPHLTGISHHAYM